VTPYAGDEEVQEVFKYGAEHLIDFLQLS